MSMFETETQQSAFDIINELPHRTTSQTFQTLSPATSSARRRRSNVLMAQYVNNLHTKHGSQLTSRRQAGSTSCQNVNTSPSKHLPPIHGHVTNRPTTAQKTYKT